MYAMTVDARGFGDTAPQAADALNIVVASYRRGSVNAHRAVVTVTGAPTGRRILRRSREANTVELALHALLNEVIEGVSMAVAFLPSWWDPILNEGREGDADEVLEQDE
jgi:hypothetical protein